MKVKVENIKQYNSTYKHVVIVNDVPVCITESSKRASECIQYLNGYNADINDGAIKKILDKYRMQEVNKDTQMKRNRKEKHNAIHGFSENVS